jgi:hypothetical protein
MIWPRALTATKVRPGGWCSWIDLASASPVSRSQEKLSQAAMIGRMNDHIALRSRAPAA